VQRSIRHERTRAKEMPIRKPFLMGIFNFLNVWRANHIRAVIRAD
jgi:hypothetical protein